MRNEIVRNIIKDFKIEFRNPSAFYTAVSFSGISTIAVSLVSRSMTFQPLVLSILFWLIIFFSAMNSLLHIFTREEDCGTAMFLQVSTSSVSIYVSKLIFNTVFLIFILVIITPLFIVFLQMNIQSPMYFAASLCSGGIAIAGCTTILSAIVAKAGGKGSLFTVISFPILLPVLWVCIAATNDSLEQALFWDTGSIVFLLAFSGMIVALSTQLIRFIWLDE